MKIFCISLAGSPRRERAERELEETGLPYEFINAVDGRRGWCDGVPKIADHWGGSLRPTEAGCYYSHTKVLQRIMEDELHYAIVTEDDFKCIEHGGGMGFVEVCEDADRLVPGWDHLQLHGMARDWDDEYHRTGERVGDFHRVVSTTLCTSSYAVGRRLADLVLCRYPEAKMPIDHLYAQIGKFREFNFYDLEHPIADIEVLPSTVVEGRTLDNPMP